MTRKILLLVVINFMLLTLWTMAQTAPRAKLAWNAVTTNINNQPITGVTYNAYRSANSDGSAASKINSTAIATTTYADTTVTASGIYYYYVTAITTAGVEGGRSSIVRFTFGDFVPANPTGLTATAE